MAEIVIKHAHCIPCDLVIDVKKFRTEARSKSAQDYRINPLIGKHRCPKCKAPASISTPVAQWDNQRPPNPIRKADGSVLIKYERTQTP